MELLLGKKEDDTPFLFNSDFFTKHAVVFGATGSGKTVMCKNIIEESAMQGIPVIAIDPKGDIGGLAMFNEEFNFGKWTQEDARAQGMIRDEDKAKYIAQIQEQYKKNLAAALSARSAAPTEYVKQFMDKVQVNIFTPKSSVGKSISISPELSPPDGFQDLVESDPNQVNDLIESAAFSLLRLVGYDEEDKTEISFVSQIISNQWEMGSSLDIKQLVKLTKDPPFEEIGALTVEEFINEKARLKLASNINLLLTSPAFKSWFQGQPINFDTFYGNNNDKVNINVMDLRWITEEKEKQFFVGMLTQELFKWLIKQGGTQNLRYILYFDEMAGYLPSDPKNPPSKKGLKILIKQARAFGLGCVFATQNPGDIDYTVLSNIGTKFLGNLKTERDVQKVAAGMDMNASKLLEEFGKLKTLQFIFHNPDVNSELMKIRPRWLLTYHRGPLTEVEIKELMSKTVVEEIVDAPVKKKKKDVVRVTGVEEAFGETMVTTPELVSNSGFENAQLSPTKTEIHCKPTLFIEMSASISEKLAGLTNPYAREETRTVLVDLSEEDGSVNINPETPSFTVGKDMIAELKRVAGGSQHELEKLKPVKKHEHAISEQQAAFAQALSGTLYYSNRTQDVALNDMDAIRSGVAETFENEKDRKADKFEDVLEKATLKVENKKDSINLKIDQIKTKIETLNKEIKDLEADKKKRQAEKKSVTQVTSGINSRKGKIKELQLKLKNEQKQLTDVQTEVDRAQKEADQQKGFLEKEYDLKISQAIKSKDLVVNEKDISILRKSLIWVAESFVITGTVPSQEGDKEVVATYSLDGQGKFGSCSVCSEDITTSTQGNICVQCAVKLCAAHSTKCDDCSEVYCKDHSEKCSYSNCENLICVNCTESHRCKDCPNIICATHEKKCNHCDQLLCAEHSIECPACKEISCDEHTRVCGTCSTKICLKHPEELCGICNEDICPLCRQECNICGAGFCEKHVTTCYQDKCDHVICNNDEEKQRCEQCHNVFCSGHLSGCKNCGKQVCQADTVLLRHKLISKEYRCKLCTTQEEIDAVNAENMKIMAVIGIIIVILAALKYTGKI